MIAREGVYPPRPHVWGIGLTRTGTTTLNAALSLLGYKAIHWPTLHEILHHEVEAATDESVAAVFRYLDVRYPGSRFVLTIRDVESWLRSTEEHRRRFDSQWSMIVKRATDEGGYWLDRKIEVQFTQAMLYGGLPFEKLRFVSGYQRHHEDVRRYFASRRECLLEIDICGGQGWSELCRFLSVKMPGVPFPHENRNQVAQSG
jgi:hypothetical protein